MKISTPYNYTRRQLPGSKKPSLTLPDQTMSLRTILERYARGLPINSIPTLDDADDEDADYHEYQKMDKIERIEYVRDYAEYVKKLRNEQLRKEQQEENARNAQQTEQVGRKAPLSSTGSHSDPDRGSARAGEWGPGNENLAPPATEGTNKSRPRNEASN